MSLALAGIRLVLRASPPPVRERLAVRLFMTVRDHGEPAREAAWRERGEAIQLAGRPCVAFGRDGPVVLLMHGWEGRGLQLSAYIEPLTAAGYRVIALDAPGHGADHAGDAGLPTWVPFLHALIDDLNPAIVIGHSIGAAAAIFAARRAGFEGQVLCLGGPPDPPQVFRRARDFMRLPESGYQRFLEGFRRRFTGLALDDLLDLEAAGRASHATIHGVLARGDDDVPPAESRRIIEAAGGTVVELDGPTHRSVMWNPEAVAAGLQLLHLCTGTVEEAP